MELTVREAATLLGKSPRTVRAQLLRGDLPGTKRDGQWRIERRTLPLTEGQRRRLQGKARDLRQALDEALPSRLARTPGQRSRSIADLEAFRRGAEVLAELRSAADETLDSELKRRVTAHLEAALLSLAEAVGQFERDAKLTAIRRARAGLARATALLLFSGEIPPAEPILRWVGLLEAEVMPAVAGFARWTEHLPRRGS